MLKKNSSENASHNQGTDQKAIQKKKKEKINGQAGNGKTTLEK